MDVKTDKTLRMRLRESMGDSTMLIVAQRVGSILDADRILVMEDGQIGGERQAPGTATYMSALPGDC